MNAVELAQALPHFSGSEEIHRWSILYPHFYLTDGAKFLADNAGAYWLMDIIGSYQRKLLAMGEVFQVWKLDVVGSAATVTCDDGNSNSLVQQEIPWTDFPLPFIELWATWDGEQLVIMLTSEY